jgi:glutathione synthase/RimK-type ligase-like ATP-grasp enzyme
VAFATAPSDYLGANDTDRPHHEAAARAAGVDLEHVVWSDPLADWSGYDLVVVRSAWDYLDHLEAFDAWLGALDGLGTLHNPAAVVRWNLDKRYLAELSTCGVPVIDTRVCDDASDVAAALRAVAGSSGEVVVKPVVSAGSRLTGRYASGDPAAAALADRILAGGTAVLVQPAVASVATEGEVAALVFGGTISHAVRKAPLLALGGGLVGGTYTERVVREDLTRGRRAVVEAASAAVARLVADRFGVHEPLLYARIDLVTLDDGSDVVLEVELAEPTFFLDAVPAAASSFAALVARRAVTG